MRERYGVEPTDIAQRLGLNAREYRQIEDSFIAGSTFERIAALIEQLAGNER